MLESKRRAIIFLTLAFLLALAAGFFVFQKVRALNTELGGMTRVYVAATSIPSRTLIQPNQVRTMEIPNRFVTESHVTDVKKLANKVLVVPLSEGDMITENMIKPVSNARSENNRLVTLYSTEKVKFDQTLEAMDRVDIIVSHQFEGKAKTEIFMKDVPVAATIERDKKFFGVALEVSANVAPDLIHMQNYSDSMRILKANVGKEDSVNAESAPENKEESVPANQQQREQTPASQAQPTGTETNPQNTNQQGTTQQQ